MKNKKYRNIEIFDMQVTLILSMAYEVFPKSLQVNCAKLEDKMKMADEKYRVSEEEHSLYCNDTMSFLEDNELIKKRARTVDDKYIGVTLTLKGLKLLKQQPQSISDEPTIGDTISDKIKDGIFDSAVSIMNGAIMKFL